MSYEGIVLRRTENLIEGIPFTCVSGLKLLLAAVRVNGSGWSLVREGGAIGGVGSCRRGGCRSRLQVRGPEEVAEVFLGSSGGEPLLGR